MSLSAISWLFCVFKKALLIHMLSGEGGKGDSIIYKGQLNLLVRVITDSKAYLILWSNQLSSCDSNQMTNRRDIFLIS